MKQDASSLELATVRNHADWAVAFIASAESAFNAHNLDATMRVYARNARLELTTEGIQDIADGVCDIRTAWHGIFQAIPHFRLQKKIIAYSDNTICNEWSGSITKRGKDKAFGMEYWIFDVEGKVAYHRLVTFFGVVNSENKRGKLIFGLKFPIIGLRIERARKKLRNQLNSKEVSCHC